LRAASGKIVSRMFPMEKVAGEVYDHQHHRGLWFTHGDVNGFDFWANEVSYNKPERLGKVVLKKAGEVKSGPKSGSLAATFDWNAPDGKTLLTEDRRMTFHSDPKLRIIDCDIKLTAVVPAKFGDTKEGTFAIRLSTQLDEKHTGKMVSSDGKEGEKLVWGKAFPWVDYYGQIDGEALGVAIFDHPSNPRYPTYWHARSYGLFAANIWGLRDFYRDKTKDGSMTIDPGKPVTFRYRVVIHPGDAQSANIAALYKEWAK
jgi:Methane oxygenase PmoA